MVEGAPLRDLARSPAAQKIGSLAAQSGLLMAHFEHRIHQPMPQRWVPEDRSDLGGVAGWEGGVLPEGKYTTFRHDLMIASMHPMHRAKWSAHELAHGIIGFAWKPGATAFFNALAARLAEVLPVALWYYFDEAYLWRCPLHAGGGPLFNEFCRDCEAAASAPTAVDSGAQRWVEDGKRFVEQELACVLKSRRLGRPVPHRIGSLELASDGLAYSAAQTLRLGSEDFHRFIELFFPPNTGWHPSLEALEARIVAVMDHLVDDTPVSPLAGDRWRWISQDIGWRLFTERAAATGYEVEFDDLIEDLAENPTEAGVSQTIEGYRELHATTDVAPPEDVFAVGYDLPRGYGRSVRQMIEGVSSACPATLELLGWKHAEVVARFVTSESPKRAPLGRRFASYLGTKSPSRVAELAAFEAAIAHANVIDLAAATCGQEGPLNDEVRLTTGLELVDASYDVVELAQSLQAGQPTVPPERPTHLAIARLPNGELFIADLTEEAADALGQLKSGPWPRALLDISDDELATLESLGIVIPAAWDADATL